MRVLITGGTGAVGRAATARLVEFGFQVKVIGRRAGMEIPGATYETCDMTDYPSLRRNVGGFEAVVHLAAIPNPSADSIEKVFLANAQGTFNVYRACEEEGIRRVVQASSINALGMFYGLKPAPLHYLPVDEEHPCAASDVYSFSKHVVEDIGDYYWRRAGICGVTLRLPWVAPAKTHETVPGRRKTVQEFCQRLMEYSLEERRQWFETAWARYNELRAQGMNENHEVYQQLSAAHPDWFEVDMNMMANRVNFWTWLDERDAAQAIEKGLTAGYEGSHVLFVNDDHNWTGVPSSVLAEVFYPDVKMFKKNLVGSETLVSIERARQVLGFKVEYSFV